MKFKTKATTMTPQQIEDMVASVGADAKLTARQMADVFELVVVCIEAEREACAKTAETCEGDFERDTDGRTVSATRDGIANAIRARTETQE